jgi:hypothetical protein
MRKPVLWIVMICAVGVILAIGVPGPGPRGDGPRLVQQVSAMREIGLKLRQYDLDHSATETEDLKTKSIHDLVAMNVLSATDAAYLRDNQIKFYGYDPNRIGGNVPLLEGIYTHGSVPKRIICYSDISVVTSRLESTK